MKNIATGIGQEKQRFRTVEQAPHPRTVRTHKRYRTALETKPFQHNNAVSAETLDLLVKSIQDEEIVKPVNVSQVNQLSPFRYPGGKTWLVPQVRRWIQSLNYRPSVFVEPFAGGGIIGLTVAVEKLAKRVTLCELDEDVAAVWQTILGKSNKDAEWLAKKILEFQVTQENVIAAFNKEVRETRERAFRTIIKNRTQRGGILAPGASLVKAGENGKGLQSRWYPRTLAKRMQIIREHRDRIEFRHEDAFDVIREFNQTNGVAWFVDPPYTAGGKKAGKRLYIHTEIDHSLLFDLMQTAQGKFLMTYDDAEEVKELSSNHGFKVSSIPMKNTHHEIVHELLITRA